MRVPDRAGDYGIALDPNTVSNNDRGVRIELRDVWFKYPTRDVPVLNGLNMTVSFHRAKASNVMLMITKDYKGAIRRHRWPFRYIFTVKVVVFYTKFSLGCGKTSIISLLER